jgi:hypothetical protein
MSRGATLRSEEANRRSEEASTASREAVAIGTEASRLSKESKESSKEALLLGREANRLSAESHKASRDALSIGRKANEISRESLKASREANKQGETAAATAREGLKRAIALEREDSSFGSVLSLDSAQSFRKALGPGANEFLVKVRNLSSRPRVFRVEASAFGFEMFEQPEWKNKLPEQTVAPGEVYEKRLTWTVSAKSGARCTGSDNPRLELRVYPRVEQRDPSHSWTFSYQCRDDRYMPE